MLNLIVAFVSLQFIDSAMTVWVVKRGIATELNPMAFSMVRSWWNVPLKVVSSLLVCLLIVWTIKKMPRLRKPLVVGLACVVILMTLVVINGFVQIVLHYTIS